MSDGKYWLPKIRWHSRSAASGPTALCSLRRPTRYVSVARLVETAHRLSRCVTGFPEVSTKLARPYVNPYLAGLLLGVVLFLAFFITGQDLGASGAISRVQVAATGLVSPEHVDRTAPFAEVGGGSRNALDHGSVFMLLGTFLGGALSGLWNRRFRVELRKGPRVGATLRLVCALVGGAIMGYGARLARGCTSGQALTGGAVLSVGSFAFMFAVFGGGYLIAWFVRRLWI